MSDSEYVVYFDEDGVTERGILQEERDDTVMVQVGPRTEIEVDQEDVHRKRYERFDRDEEWQEELGL